MSSGGRQVCLGVYSPSAASDCPRLPDLSALEGIKGELQRISERPTTDKENEGDTIAVSNLADNLRDTIVEYQVGTAIETPTPISSAHAAHSSRSRRRSTSKAAN